MRWGLVLFWARDARDGVKRINARAESIVSTASFREAIKKWRCLVPADAFYEWQKIGAKTKQAFAIGMLDGSTMHTMLSPGKNLYCTERRVVNRPGDGSMGVDKRAQKYRA